MNAYDETRRGVAAAYGAAVSRPAGGGCCGDPAAAGGFSQLAGYSPAELQGLPPGAVVNALGSGHPLAFSEVGEGDVVLDLGSGAGIDVLLAAKKVGPSGRVIGVDMTEEMIAKANENIAAAGLANVEMRKGIIEDLPVESCSVDWVISNCVINLSPEKRRVFAEIARVLRPGGRVAISDIVVEDLPDPLRRSAALCNSCVGRAVSEREYGDGLREAGLEEVTVRHRTVYDAATIEAFVASEPSVAELASACRGPAPRAAAVRDLATSVAGKVVSAVFSARKPTG